MENKNIKLVVFDIAGTTVKDHGNIADSFIYALSKFGFPVDREEVNKLMGYKKPVAISLLLEKFYPGEIERDQLLVDKIHDVFIDAMVDFYQSDTSLEPMGSAEHLFLQLQANNIKVALNTGFSRRITDAILEQIDWVNNPLIDFVICSDEVENGRPSSDMIQAIMAATGIDNADEIAKVGDTEVDIQEGREAGCALVIGVSTGAYSRKQLLSCYPDAVIDDLSELQAILKLGVLAK